MKNETKILPRSRGRGTMRSMVDGVRRCQFMLIFALSILSAATTSCTTIKRIKGNKPNCPSYNYSSFMGQTKDWVIAQNIKDSYVFLEYGIDNGARTDTKVAFNIENGIVSGIGCY